MTVDREAGAARWPAAGRWRAGRRIVVAWGLAASLLAGAVLAQPPSDGAARTIAELGDFEYAVRMEAARRIRRLDPGVARPLLLDAADTHEDSYVQFRAAVLLTGFGGARAFFREALDAPNDRLRAAAYEVAEHDPDPALAPRLLAALDRETSEFVRPALLRALAAQGGHAAVRERLVREVDRGQGVFRAAVIEALGVHGAGYAVEPLLRIAAASGPLRDDALIALGRIGDARALPVIASAQAAAADTRQPVVSAAACLLGADCGNQVRYVMEALAFGAASAGEHQVLLRASASAASALAAAGRDDVLEGLVAAGIPSVDPARAPLALAFGAVALADPVRVLGALAGRSDLEAALLLLRDAFDMLDEDLAEERFFVAARRLFADDRQMPAARAAAESAVRILEF